MLTRFLEHELEFLLLLMLPPVITQSTLPQQYNVHNVHSFDSVPPIPLSLFTLFFAMLHFLINYFSLYLKLPLDYCGAIIQRSLVFKMLFQIKNLYAYHSWTKFIQVLCAAEQVVKEGSNLSLSAVQRRHRSAHSTLASLTLSRWQLVFFGSSSYDPGS